MDIKKLEEEITDEVYSREHHLSLHADEYTPSGNLRSAPMYEIFLENEHLGLSKVVKSKCPTEVQVKARKQLEMWNKREIKERLNEAKADLGSKVDFDNEKLEEDRKQLENILNVTLDIDDKIDWEEMKDKSSFEAFKFDKKHPERPLEPRKTFWDHIFSFLYTKKIELFKNATTDWEEEVKKIDSEKEVLLRSHDKEKEAFLKQQKEANFRIDKFKERFESKEEEAILEYVSSVFERSDYPDFFFMEYFPKYDEPSKTMVIDINLPSQEKISKVKEYKYQKSKGQISETLLKDKDYDALYDSAVKQSVLRTIHEVFESVYTDAVDGVVVNAWVEYVDPATGSDQVSCVISISTSREQFEAIKLDRIEVDACIKSLKGIVAGPISQLAPVKPIMQLNTKDKRFVESKDQLAEMNATTNLAEMHWEDFEHLVRELFGKMFSNEGTEVHVTQASSDGGIDAVAFDPDPIRGGKFVIQAKRYTKTVGVSAVRDLYGTMISEGAVKGILVTTATYGRDSREFSKDKPISLIDGSNLVYLLEKHGHKVKIDLKEARAKMKKSA